MRKRENILACLKLINFNTFSCLDWTNSRTYKHQAKLFICHRQLKIVGLSFTTSVTHLLPILVIRAIASGHSLAVVAEADLIAWCIARHAQLGCHQATRPGLLLIACLVTHALADDAPLVAGIALHPRENMCLHFPWLPPRLVAVGLVGFSLWRRLVHVGLLLVGLRFVDGVSSAFVRRTRRLPFFRCC